MTSQSQVSASTAADPGEAYIPLVPQGFPPDTPQPTPTGVFLGEIYYVSKLGGNENGSTWATAWNELDQIDWTQIEPGDTILLDGGDTTMTYTTGLELAASGTSGMPISIRLATEPGRNGQAKIFGGRSNPLPYCDQPDYDDTGEDDALRWGIITDDQDWVTIDGGKWRGISIYGFRTNGIRIEETSHDILIRNVEVYDNGYSYEEGGLWYSDSPGIMLGGQNVTIERAIVHDNGQDAIQSKFDPNNIDNFTLRQSWLHNERPHPTVPESFNYCTHTDGIHFYTGGLISGVTVEESIIGPGFTQNILLGQEPSGSNSVDVHNVTFRNVLFTKAADNSITSKADTGAQNWVLENITNHCPNTKGHCITINNSNHTVRNSIVHSASIRFEDGLDNFSNNCQWQTTGFDIGLDADPQFVSVSNDPLSLDDYTVPNGSPCVGRGSSITSVNQLLSLPDN